ncbi:MAG: hypothetical protein LBS96_03225 [Oscillospiraceae bacterium]|nr:hypothetical protein [Oscillospiraceae bacterium]
MKHIKQSAAVLLCVCLLLGSLGGASAGAAFWPRSRPADGSLNAYRLPLDPVDVTLGGESYNLVNPFAALGAWVAAACGGENALKYVGLTYLEWLFTDVLSLLAAVLPASEKILTEAAFRAGDVTAGFLPGSAAFTQTPGETWRLGFAQTSLLPDDILTAQQKYYLAGFFNGRLPEGKLDYPGNDVKQVLDDMMVRVTVLDAGQGKVVLAAIDCIGIANADVQQIRLLLADFAKANDIISINVFATHSHSCLDTLGLWNPFVGKALNNIAAKFLPWLTEKGGADAEFMTLLRTRTADTIRAAVADMKPGQLFSASKDISDYLADKRLPRSVMGDMLRLRFAPAEPGARPTVILNMSAHPDTTGLQVSDGKSDGTGLSADFPYYIAAELEKAGYNCLFINGAIAGIDPARGASDDGLDLPTRHDSTIRYGRELGWVALSMTKTRAQIEASAYVDAAAIAAEQAQSSGYSLWYEDWQPVQETEVAPILNIRHAQVEVTVEQPIVLALGKLGLVNHNVYRAADGTYRTVTEIGYLQIGSALKAAFFPGEVLPELVTGGGACDAENAFNGQDFAWPSLDEIVGGDLLLFGLANDMLGYILPDTDYTMSFVDSTRQNSNQELVTFGRHIGSTLVAAFADLWTKIGVA